MRTNKFFILILLVTSLVSCGSSERVITDNGEVYYIDGKTIKKNGEKVNANLDESEVKKIYDLLEEKVERRKAEDKKIEELKNAIEAQEKIEKQAKEKQDQLKSELDELDSLRKARQDARDDYARIYNNYTEAKNELNKLKDKGELSSIELKEKEADLKKLEVKLEKAKMRLEKYL